MFLPYILDSPRIDPSQNTENRNVSKPKYVTGQKVELFSQNTPSDNNFFLGASLTDRVTLKFFFFIIRIIQKTSETGMECDSCVGARCFWLII